MKPFDGTMDVNSGDLGFVVQDYIDVIVDQI